MEAASVLTLAVRPSAGSRHGRACSHRRTTSQMPRPTKASTLQHTETSSQRPAATVCWRGDRGANAPRPAPRHLLEQDGHAQGHLGLAQLGLLGRRARAQVRAADPDLRQGRPLGRVQAPVGQARVKQELPVEVGRVGICSQSPTSAMLGSTRAATQGLKMKRAHEQWKPVWPLWMPGLMPGSPIRVLCQWDS